MSAVEIPPGGTILDTFKKSFSDVPVNAEKDNAISTTEFLDAAESLTTIFGSYLLFIFHFYPPTAPGTPFITPAVHKLTCHPCPITIDALGSVAFSPVKSDLLGNIKKVRERQLAAPAESETLQELVINELKTKKHVATEGLLWLVR